jgi:hypothetical protein
MTMRILGAILVAAAALAGCGESCPDFGSDGPQGKPCFDVGLTCSYPASTYKCGVNFRYFCISGCPETDMAVPADLTPPADLGGSCSSDANLCSG